MKMIEQPLVSIAMPVYNAEKYIKKAIDSVLAQTYTNFELVIVNDASPDSSKQIILSYSDPRIRYIENEVNLGIVKTRNKCIRHTKGKYIAVLDNDDIALPQRLEKQLEFLEKNTGYGMCGSFYEVIDGNDQLVNKIKTPVTDEEIRTYLLFDNCFCNSSVMIRSEFLKHRLYTEDFNMIEDYHFLHTLSKQAKLTSLPIYTTQYRIHGKNTSIEKQDGMRALRVKMNIMILNDLRIPFTEQELILHSNFVDANFQFFKTNAQLRQLETWLIKLYRALKNNKSYDMRMIQTVFIKRWILLFSHTNKISHKVLFNKLFGTFKLNYIRFFLELLKEKNSIIKSLS